MKKLLLSLAAVALCVSVSAQSLMSWDEATLKAKELVSKLTLEEKLNMTHGYNRFFLPGVPSKGIPYVFMSDASVGVRINHSIPDPKMIQLPKKTTQFPSSILLAATFNPSLSEACGKAVGEESRMCGVSVLLGPGMNIYRNSQCGRNFEYCGEDPYLAARLVEKYVTGMQSTGTLSCLKHFVCNNTEFYRRRSNSIVDERALMEIYTPAFKAGIDAGAACVMTSYNQLNGEWASQSKYVIKDLLRGTLGFKGLVMSDWSAIYDWKKVVLSGQNADMPGSNYFYVKRTAKDLVEAGELTEKDIEEMIIPQIATCIRFGLYDRILNGKQYAWELKNKMPEHEKLVSEIAAEGIVLLKNNGILPLQKGSRILLVGRWAKEIAQGGGSSKVKGYNLVSLQKALETEFGKENVTVSVEGYRTDIVNADVVICATGTRDRESTERPFLMAKEDEQLVRDATLNNKRTIVIVNSGSGIDMSAWNENAAAILYGFYPGQNGNTAMAEILAGKINPSGKLPMTIEKSFKDSPAVDTYPEGASLTVAARNPNEKMFQTWTYDIHYKESILVGYRWYEKKNIEPLYPFGFGLSYSKFSISDGKIVAKGAKKIMPKDGCLKVAVNVCNEGQRDGKEVVQFYVAEKNPTVLRPIKELKAFEKVSVKPGEKKVVTADIAYQTIGFWDEKSHCWKVNPGEYEILVGTSSKDIAATLPFTVE
ncbi:MAG: glycoside hydrolase family 3 C-terminal domain-containing protein [Alistipes sp.]|nr:glycoside hydrolase family 3 C-terminal domain-containing protein [Candidatus Alistipes equi]